MHVAHLSLHDFRSYADAELPLTGGVTVFLGRNGQGKTNLVEAVDYLARLGSHRVATDAPLVRQGAERAVVRAAVVRADRQALLEVEINPGRSNRARVNRSPLPRARELLGWVRTVLFAPEDLALVKGDPGDRRRFLDDLLVLRAPRYAGVRGDLDRVLRQRNALLRSARQQRSRARSRPDEHLESTLAVWDEQLVRLGAELVAARMDLVAALSPLVGDAYAAVAKDAARTQVVLTYQSSASPPAGPSGPPVAAPDGAAAAPAGAERGTGPATGPATGGMTGGMADAASEAASEGASGGATDRAAVAAGLRSELDRRRGEELDRGVTLVGPHRDDLVLALGTLPVRGYASHGESWSLALALRLASYDLLRGDGDDPILILDDVFAELDTDRRDRLAELVAGAEQVLVTAAVPADVPAALRGARFVVADGRVEAAA